MFYFRFLSIVISILVIASPSWAEPSLIFENFLRSYLSKSVDVLGARRQLSQAERQKAQGRDQWKSRLEGDNQLSFQKQEFDASSFANNSNRSSNTVGRFTQIAPSGTSLELNARKFWETANPLGSALDRSYSAKISQDLVRNSFGRTQRAESKQATINFEVAELEFRQSVVNSCETAFTLYTEAYIQQEIAALLKAQYQDAERAVKISRKLYKDKLINNIDKLTSESDFINTRLQYEQAEQRLINSKLRIQAFLEDRPPLSFKLFDPSKYIFGKKGRQYNETLAEVIADKRVDRQEMGVEQAKTDRWTDVQVGLEVGERFGRLAFSGTPTNYSEEYLTANLSFGFDLINRTEDGNLRNAVKIKNTLEVEKVITGKTQKNLISSLTAMDSLLASQVKSSAQQVKLLKEKMDIAFTQMQRAKLDFQTYLLHRNAYLNQQQSYLNLKRDLLLNQFSLQKEFAHQTPDLCEVRS